MPKNIKERLTGKLTTVDNALRQMDKMLVATRTESFTTDPYPYVEDALYAVWRALEKLQAEVADLE